MVKNELKVLRNLASATARFALGNYEAQYEMADALEALAGLNQGKLYQRAADANRAEAVVRDGRLFASKGGCEKLAEALLKHANANVEEGEHLKLLSLAKKLREMVA